MSIPIQNIYYLLVYAWDTLDEADLVDVDAADHTSLLDLFAQVLNNGVQHLIRRGLDRDYLSHADTIAGVRGKIRIAESLKRLTIPQARLCCEFDEFSYDVVHNQIVKSTLRTLSRCDLVEAGTRHALCLTHRRLPEVTDIHVSDQVFRRVQLHRNNRFYRFLLEVCRIIAHNLLVDERGGQSQFRDFVRDPKMMARLFEKFVRNFYRREQARYVVSAERFPWQATEASDEDFELLPSMLTDISLRDDSRYLVFDTKFYPEAFQKHHGTKRLHSGHLYQLFAYMQNLAVRHGPALHVDGALLYPAVDYQLDLRYEIHGHTLRVVSIDLDQSWQRIRGDLLGLLDAFRQTPAVAAN